MERSGTDVALLERAPTRDGGAGADGSVTLPAAPGSADDKAIVATQNGGAGVDASVTLPAAPGSADDKVIVATQNGDANADVSVPLPAVLESADDKANVPPLKRLPFVDRWLSLWVLLTMIVGVIIGNFAPSVASALNSSQIITVSLPVAFGLWFMMWPVLVKVSYESLGSIFRQREIWRFMGVSLILNWIVGPLLMLALAWATLPDLPLYRNGVIMVGLARCIAMVLIWNQLARGDPEYCAILVAINSVLQMVLYAPLTLFYLQVVSRQYLGGGDTLNLSFWLVCRSVLLFLGVPLAAAVVTRYGVMAIGGREWFQRKFVPVISPLALIALLWTIFAMFVLQGQSIVHDIGSVFRVMVPLVLYFAIIFSSVLWLCWTLHYEYRKAVTQSFTASSNNFELAIAIAASTFGTDSPEALAATIGPLVEVPVLLSFVYLALWIRTKVQWR